MSLFLRRQNKADAREYTEIALGGDAEKLYDEQGTAAEPTRKQVYLISAEEAAASPSYGAVRAHTVYFVVDGEGYSAILQDRIARSDSNS